jgi:ferredoxin
MSEGASDVTEIDALSQAVTLAKSVAMLQRSIEAGQAMAGTLHPSLIGPLCKLLKTLEPNVGKKLDEYIEVYDQKLSGKETTLKVSTSQHGGDLVDEEGNAMELKTSVHKKGKKVNFNWQIGSPVAPAGKRRTELVKSITGKTKKYGCKLIVKDHKNLTIAEFKLSPEFLIGYFTRVKLGKCGVHNMGCTACGSCGSFHRLEKMVLYDRYMEKHGKTDLCDEQWKDVFSKCVSDCKNTPTRIKE